MTLRATVAAGLLAMALAVPGSSQQAVQQRSTCLPARDLAQKMFLRLDGFDLKFTFVWVDDIRSKFVGGYYPFEVYVVTGRVYTPFEMQSGKLERAAFQRLSRPSRNIERFGPLTVPPQFSPSQPPALNFVSGTARYQVRVVGVKPSRFGGEDTVTIQVCRESR
jgi:hypothetical protein